MFSFQKIIQNNILKGGFKKVKKDFAKRYIHYAERCKHYKTSGKKMSELFLIRLLACTTTEFYILILNYNKLQPKLQLFMRLIIRAIDNCNKNEIRWFTDISDRKGCNYTNNPDRSIFMELWMYKLMPLDLYIDALKINLSDKNFYDVWEKYSLYKKRLPLILYNTVAQKRNEQVDFENRTKLAIFFGRKIWIMHIASFLS